MQLLSVFAMIGIIINDLISIYSLIGSFMLLLGSFSDSSLFRSFANWSILGLFFGGISQMAMAITGTIPEKIGIVYPMPASTVNGILFLSFMLLIGQWLVKRTR